MQLQLRQPALADRRVLVAAVDGREGRDPVQSVRNGDAALKAELVAAADRSGF
jgi:hypothetical protein